MMLSTKNYTSGYETTNKDSDVGLVIKSYFKVIKKHAYTCDVINHQTNDIAQLSTYKRLYM